VQKLLIFTFFLLMLTSVKSQIPDQQELTVLLRKESSLYGGLHTSGIGFGYRAGKNITSVKKRFIDTEIFTIKHSKEVKISKSQFYIDAKSYVYGKENSFFATQASYGSQKILNSKPYWGGVEVRSFYSIGGVLGFTKPIYLYVYDLSTPTPIRVLEKYDPIKHVDDYIFGRGPFIKGINEIKAHPGFFARAGFSFEHAYDREQIRALELGVKISIFPKPIRIMSYSDNDFYFVNLYINYHFGSRKE